MKIYNIKDIPQHLLKYFEPAPEIGLEQTPEQYISKLVEVFREVRRVLRDDGTLWIIIGDCYAGSGKGAAQPPENAMKYKQWTNKGILGAQILRNVKPQNCKAKDLIGIPWMLAFALRADGWYLRQDIIWHKPNVMPESVKDRCTKSHEYMFLLSKSRKYYFDADAISEPATTTDNSLRNRSYTTRNKRDVWTVANKPFKDAHFATYPPELIRPCILAGSRRDGIVLDPFIGSGTTGIVAIAEGRRIIGIDINPDYAELAKNRIEKAKKESM